MITLADLLALAPSQLARRWRRFWYARLEQHYLICADVEMQRVREHQANVRHYQSKAALARSDRI